MTEAQRRWRMAYTAIYSVRVMVSLNKEIVSRNKIHIGSASEIVDDHVIYSFVAVDIDPCDVPEKEGIKDFVLTGETQSYGNIQTKLSEMVRNKNLEVLKRQFHGVEGVIKTLQSDRGNGINVHEVNISERRKIFGSNTYLRKPPKGLLFFVMDAFKDTTMLILLVCAALALGFGIKEHGAKEGWYEGGSIFLAVFLVIVVSASSNLKQERQFHNLSKISSNIKVEVMRNGRRTEISIFDIVVGDVVFLKIGDQVPADGLFLEGHSLQVDESSMTGESEYIDVDSKHNPFLLSGSKVADGYGQMLVTSVGMNTAWGEMMSSITNDVSVRTPLQERLDVLTSSIGKVGLTVAFLVLVVLLVRYFTGNTKDAEGNTQYLGSKTKRDDIFNAVIKIVSGAVTIVVVAIPEGLPLAVTLTLAYSMKRMMKDHAMVRNLSACETMGSATVICTDKTGTLTLNQMKVTKFWLGQEITEEQVEKGINSSIVDLLRQGVGLNTTGNVYKTDSVSPPEVTGSPTEKAILSWAIQDWGMDMELLKKSCDILYVETFNSEKKRSGILMHQNVNGTKHVHWKGAAEIILSMCSSYYCINGGTAVLDAERRNSIENVIQGMAAGSLRCIAFAHAEVSDKESKLTLQDQTLHCKLRENNLTLLGIVGLKDPCRPGVKKAVEACEAAMVEIKMITGDNLFTAKAIATECGILKYNEEMREGEVVEGIEFRNYNEQERMEKVDKIRVMARSSPSDKLLMVNCLKAKGHVVAVTGDGTNDAPALKAADIGLSMGIQGTEVAKESSDIVILDDNFTSVATVLRWGRCVYNNIQKFIQFQLTVNIAALVINFIAAVSAGEVPLTAVQLLWVNLIMDTLGALALATERPTDELMHKPPVGRTAPLITNIMWRNILAQSLYQIAVLLTLQFKGESIFRVTPAVNDTLIFNTFVICQIFNEFNSRKMEKQNVFEGILGNRLFLGIIAATILLQVIMVEFLKKFADTERLNWGQWGICILIAAISWPIAWCVKLIQVPDKPILNYFRELKNPTSKGNKDTSSDDH